MTSLLKGDVSRTLKRLRITQHRHDGKITPSNFKTNSTLQYGSAPRWVGVIKKTTKCHEN